MIDPALRNLMHRVLAELQIAIGAERLELFEYREQGADQETADEIPFVRISCGQSTEALHTSDLPFAGYLLRVAARGTLPPDALTEIKLHQRLAAILLRGVYTPDRSNADPDAPVDRRPRLRTRFLTDTLIELLHLLEERGRKIENYVKIIELNEKILAANELYDVLQLVMDLATTAIGGEDAALLLVDPRTGEMTFKVVAETRDDEEPDPPQPRAEASENGDSRGDTNTRKLEQIRIPAGQGIAGSVVLSARAEIIRDVTADERSFQKVDRVLGQTTRDMVVAPIVARGRVIGVIEVINSRAQTGFLSEHLEMLQHIASHASLFIENMRGKEQIARANLALDRRATEAHVLADLSALVCERDVTPHDRHAPDRAARFLQVLASGLRLPAATLLTVDPTQRKLRELARFPASDAPPGEWVETTDLLLWLLQNREPFRFNADGAVARDAGSSDGAASASAPGLELRFREANPEWSTPRCVWLPVLSADERHQIEYIVSLSDLAIPDDELAESRVFFRSLMNLSRAIFTLDA